MVGLPLHDEYSGLIDEDGIIYLGYIDWINHLFEYGDLMVLTDDGISIAEAITCKKPIVTLARVKWGRYQNIAGVFKGAIIESEVKDVYESIQLAFKDYNSLQKKSIFYAKECLEASDTLAEDILKKIKYSGIIATDF